MALDLNDPELMWAPAHPEKAQASLFRNHINEKYGLNLDSYEDLWKWSCENRGDYWSEVWDWEGVVGDKGDAPVCRTTPAGQGKKDDRRHANGLKLCPKSPHLREIQLTETVRRRGGSAG